MHGAVRIYIIVLKFHSIIIVINIISIRIGWADQRHGQRCMFIILDDETVLCILTKNMVLCDYLKNVIIS